MYGSIGLWNSKSAHEGPWGGIENKLTKQQHSPNMKEKILIQRIEEVTGQHYDSPKDFDKLSQQIFFKTEEMVSPSTLKRLWGYIDSVSSLLTYLPAFWAIATTRPSKSIMSMPMCRATSPSATKSRVRISLSATCWSSAGCPTAFVG